MRHGGALVCGLLLLGAGAVDARTPTASVVGSVVPGGLPHAALVVLLAGSLLATLMLFVAVLALRRSRNRATAACAELHSANAALAQKLKIRTDFLATTSHEIRTPLNGILGMTQVMLADQRLAPDLRERISAAQSAGETMKSLVDDILDMAKIESGILTIDRAPLDLRALLTETVQLWRAQADGKGIRLDLDLGLCPGLIEGDRVRLRQIVCNLVSNALKFTATGSVSVTAAAETLEGSETVVLRVRDTGIGIAPEQQGLVFEQFRQADGSIARRFGGTGLGLAICRSVVEAMGGTIALNSRIGEGSTFTVRLPLVRAANRSPVHHELPDAPVAALAEARLLIVEQNALTRRILCNMLDGFVGRIEAVSTIQEARERLAAGGIHHVVADAASAAPVEGGNGPTLERLASSARKSGARMTLLFQPSRSDEAARLVAARPEVQPIAKPIAAPALVDALHRLYESDRAPVRTERVLAAADAG